MSKPSNNQAFSDVIFYTNLYPSNADLQQGLFIEQLALVLDKNYPVTVICPTPWFPRHRLLKKLGISHPVTTIPSFTIRQNITVHYPRYLLIPKLSKYTHSLFMFLGTLTTTLKICRSKKKAIISAHWIYPDCTSAVLLNLFVKIPLIVGARGCDINLNFKDRLLKKLLIFTLNRANAVVAVSNDLTKTIINQGISENKVHTIPNGINQTLFTPRDKTKTRQNLGLPENIKLIVYVGQLHPVKDHGTFIEGIANYISTTNANDNDLMVLIIGDGPSKQSLIKRVIKAGLSSYITFEDQKPHDQIAKLLSAADVLCLTSIREGRPNIILESLACGTPVVASDVGGIPELINTDNGILFPAGDSTAFSKSLNDALTKQWNSKAIVNSIKPFTWENTAKHYVNIIENIQNN